MSLDFDETKQAASTCLREAVTKPVDEAKAHINDQLLAKLEFRKDEPDAARVQDQQKAVEYSLSLMLEELCDIAEDKKQNVQEVGVDTFLDLSLYIAAAGSADKVLPFMLLENLFESQTITGCERAFDYIESRSAELLAPDFLKRGKLTVLRMGNEVLRRLSKSTNTVFAGRVLIFLAGAFPLSERSAVNVKSLYNTANTTVYEDEPTDNFNVDDNEMEVDAGSDQNKVICSDANFYKQFWSLQTFFAQPTKLFDPPAWIAFQQQANCILEAFEAYWISSVAASATVSSCEDDFYFPKFLTSSNLMNLQLNDAYFCRHILVQFLILVQCVVNHQSRLPPMQTLKEPQKKVLRELEARVFSLIAKIGGAQGQQFCAAVKAMLQREHHWILWKREGCTPYEKHPAEPEAQDEAAAEKPRKRKLFNVKDVWGTSKRGRLGQHALSALWKNNGDSMEELADQKQDFAPSVKSVIEPVIEELDPESGIEEQYRSKNGGLYSWRALRVLSKHCLDKCHFFGKQKDGVQNIDAIAKTLAPELDIEMSAELKALLNPEK